MIGLHNYEVHSQIKHKQALEIQLSILFVGDEGGTKIKAKMTAEPLHVSHRKPPRRQWEIKLEKV